MNEFKKLFEPDYGEISPCVYIPPTEDIDYNNAELWRAKNVPQTIAAINGYMKRCNCYDTLMEVAAFNTYMIREDNTIIPIRVYRPVGDGPFPVVVFYHGGGFSMNTFGVYDYQCRYIAAYGKALVITCEYRLMPEAKFPTGLEDCYATLEWACQHAAEYQGDISSLSVCGDSSGGNFAAVISLMARDRKGPKIHKQIMIYPLVIFKPEKRHKSEERYGTGYFLEYDSQKEPLGAYFKEGEEDKMYTPYCSPLLADDLSELPDACILAAECDPLLDQGLMYAQKLKDAGINVEYHLYKGMIHSFFNYTYEKSFDCLDAICNAIPKLI